MLGTILIVLVLLALFGTLPLWPHSRSWGYYPTGGLGLIAVILIVLLILGRIRRTTIKRRSLYQKCTLRRAEEHGS